jgi:hypothetical protein
MSVPTGKRVAVPLVAAGAVWALTAWIGLRPRPLLVVLTVVAAFACWSLVADVAGARHALNVDAPRRRLVPRWGLDARFSRLAATLRPPHDPHLVASQVHATLVGIVDERLLAHHGVDRAADPDAARAVMGDVLADYIERPPATPRNLMSYLSGMVARIEAI